MTRRSHSVCFVVPTISATSTQHFAHYPNLISEIASTRPVHVVYEKGRGEIVNVALEFHVDGEGSGPVHQVRRTLRTVRALLAAIDAGAQLFVLRYSRRALILLWALRAVHPIRIAYWSSGQQRVMPHDLSPVARAGKRLKDLSTRLIYSLPDVFLTGPESMVDYMSQTWNIPQYKIRCIRNDVDCTRFEPGEGDFSGADGSLEKPIRILFVHHLSFRRGSRLLPTIVNRLSELGVHGELRVIGDGPDRRRLELAQPSLSGSMRLNVAGPLPNSSLPNEYQAADVFLMPSYEEGFPRVLLESMATGVPIVATAAGGTVDILPPSYSYVSAVGDAEGLVRDIVKLTKNPSIRVKVAQELRSQATAHFDTTIVAQDYLRLIDEFVDV